MQPDYRLYFVADPTLTDGRDLRKVVQQAIDGGATIVQLRYKPETGSTRDFLSLAADLRDICRKRSILFIINDRLDIALAVDADGLHIGQQDLPYDTARRLLGDEKIIGVSAESFEQAMEIDRSGANYIGTGTIFATASKADACKPLGIGELGRICAAVILPVVAIGGINASNAALCFKAGVAGIAVISAISLADDPTKAAKTLLEKAFR